MQMWFTVTAYCPEIGYFVSVFDVITERKQAEEQLRDYSQNLEKMVEERTSELQGVQEKLLRQERLATMGQLAGSVGHELRNPLNVIASSIYLLTKSHSPNWMKDHRITWILLTRKPKNPRK